MRPTLSGRSMRTETTTGGGDRPQRSPGKRPWRPERREVIRLAVASMGASLTGALHTAAGAATVGRTAGRSHKPLRAAFSNIGLQVSWCALMVWSSWVSLMSGF